MTTELDDRPAPAALELVRAFVNTLDIDLGIELLRDPAEAETWFRSLDLLGGEERISRADHARVIRLREALRAMLLAHATGIENAASVVQINKEVARLGVHPAFESSTHAVIHADGRGVDRALGRILAIALAAASAGTWTRLKACPANNCHWAYYDISKNRSARWCYMQLCGAKAKRENFRRRHAPHPPAEHRQPQTTDRANTQTRVNTALTETPRTTRPSRNRAPPAGEP